MLLYDAKFSQGSRDWPGWGSVGMKKRQTLRKAGIGRSGLSRGETSAPWKLSLFIVRRGRAVAYSWIEEAGLTHLGRRL